MTAPLLRTLGELRAELQVRCGFGSSGAAAGVNRDNMNSFLQNAQRLLYNLHNWARLRRYTTVTLGSASTLVDYPTGYDPDRISAISVLRGGVWSRPLPKGISPQLYTTQTSMPSWPQRWEPYEQIEIWPQSDQAYSLRIFGMKSCDRFTQDNDRASVDDGDLFLIALARAKAHYRQPDAQVAEKDAETLLMKLKARSWGKTVFSVYDYTEEEPTIKPVVV